MPPEFYITCPKCGHRYNVHKMIYDEGENFSMADIEEICALGRKVGELQDNGKKIRVQADNGTDLSAEIGGLEPGLFANWWGRIPFGRNQKTGKLAGGTWPWGEAHVEPLPGTANGKVVWEVTAQYPPGRWKHPVTLVIENGRCVDIQGKTEAAQVREFITKYGDENSCARLSIACAKRGRWSARWKLRMYSI